MGEILSDTAVDYKYFAEISEGLSTGKLAMVSVLSLPSIMIDEADGLSKSEKYKKEFLRNLNRLR